MDPYYRSTGRIHSSLDTSRVPNIISLRLDVAFPTARHHEVFKGLGEWALGELNSELNGIHLVTALVSLLHLAKEKWIKSYTGSRVKLIELSCQGCVVDKYYSTSRYP